MKKRYVNLTIIILLNLTTVFFIQAQSNEKPNNIQVGAYYFEGWAGTNALSNNPNEPWAKNAPTHLTRSLVENFSDREPLWGWRDDSVNIMEKEIDLAADHGLTYFSFCWYWHNDKDSLNKIAVKNDPKNSVIDRFLKAKNYNRMKFCLMIANHTGFEIKGTERWAEAITFLMPYLLDKQYLTVDGKPLVIIFDGNGMNKSSMEMIQEMAKQNGLKGLSVATAGNGSPDTGFSLRTNYAIAPGWKKGSQAHPYSELIAAGVASWNGNSQEPYIPLVTSGRDTRAWEGKNEPYYNSPNWYYADRTPTQFKEFLFKAISWMDENPNKTTKERLILIYAWNELGEGGYILPTKGDPNGDYLKALQSVVEQHK